MKTLSTAALGALSAVVVEGQTVRIEKQLDRKLYEEVNKALVALGGKWSRKLTAHVFDGKARDSIIDAIEQVIACGGFVDKKQELGQFFTPVKVADLLVKLADVGERDTVLEPSAGHGAIIDALQNGRPLINITAIEIDNENNKALSLIRSLSVRIHGDFMKLTPLSHSARYDRIVMNPPFARGADIDHVLQAFKFLKPGGRLVSVMSAGVTFRQDKKGAEFRLFVRRNAPDTIDYPGRPCGEAGFFELPDGAFASSGTQVRTVIVVLEKKP